MEINMLMTKEALIKYIKEISEEHCIEIFSVSGMEFTNVGGVKFIVSFIDKGETKNTSLEDGIITVEMPCKIRREKIL